MPGTYNGGLNAAETNKARYGDDFYRIIGAKGGKAGTNRDWTLTPEGRAHLSEAGRRGGAASRRGKAKHD
jgi:general stress protein YciG